MRSPNLLQTQVDLPDHRSAGSRRCSCKWLCVLTLLGGSGFAIFCSKKVLSGGRKFLVVDKPAMTIDLSSSSSTSSSSSSKSGGGDGKTKGILLRWVEEKGFGFIKPADGGEDMFVHHSGLVDKDSVQPGDEVSFVKEWDDRKSKWNAKDVAFVSRPEPTEAPPVPEGDAEDDEEESQEQKKRRKKAATVAAAVALEGQKKQKIRKEAAAAASDYWQKMLLPARAPPPEPEGDGEGGDEGEEEEAAPVDPFAKAAAEKKASDEKIFKAGPAGINFDVYDEVPVECTGDDVPKGIEKFTEAKLPKTLMANIDRCKYTKPTPVQKHSIPIALAKRDMMACAQTGSGKTAGFMFPIITRLLQECKDKIHGTQPYEYGRSVSPVALVMAPTRELAVQIHEETNKFAYQTGIRAVVLYGGQKPAEQIRQIERGADIIIATPGRLKDFIDRERVSLEAVEYLTLDEADRMLDMGFEPVIREIVEQKGMPPKEKRQTMMFSATFPEEMQHLAADFLNKYLFLTVGRVGASCDLVEQRVWKVDAWEKQGKLMEIVESMSGLMLVFVQMKREANDLETYLRQNGKPALSIHGDRNQNEREFALRQFKAGKAKILVATDVAARGLDIPHVTQVVNYALPENIDDYVHRIGRTGRAGRKGVATAFFDPNKNGAMAPDLEETLEGAKQEVPEWLKEFAQQWRSRPKRKNRRFGGQDARKSGWNPVPIGGR